MNDKIYKITLADGTVIENLKLNGNNFVSQKPLNEEDFAGRLSAVTINDGEKDTVYEHMAFVQLAHYDDGYYFILRQLSQRELSDLKTRADIEYIAMMTEVEI